jgi:hypothetical protein
VDGDGLPMHSAPTPCTYVRACPPTRDAHVKELASRDHPALAPRKRLRSSRPSVVLHRSSVACASALGHLVVHTPATSSRTWSMKHVRDDVRTAERMVRCSTTSSPPSHLP